MPIIFYLTIDCDTGQHSQFLQCLWTSIIFGDKLIKRENKRGLSENYGSFPRWFSPLNDSASLQMEALFCNKLLVKSVWDFIARQLAKGKGEIHLVWWTPNWRVQLRGCNTPPLLKEEQNLSKPFYGFALHNNALSLLWFWFSHLHCCKRLALNLNSGRQKFEKVENEENVNFVISLSK